MKLVEIAEIPKAEFVDSSGAVEAIYKLCLELQMFCESKQGAGLSAVQCGIPQHVFVVKAREDTWYGKANQYGYFANCTYTGSKKKVLSSEGCLSIPGKMYRVKRHETVQVKGLQLTKKDGKLILDPFDREILFNKGGIVFQHEIDHGFGKLISDEGEEIFVWV